MIYSIGAHKYINYVPHSNEYKYWRSKLSQGEYQLIFDELNNQINSDNIATSSWIPGSNWTNSVYHPIWDKACEHDEEVAAKFFGLLLWEVVLLHEDVWGFGRYKKDDIPIEGLTYFKLGNPPVK